MNRDDAITAGLAGLAAIETCAAGHSDEVNVTHLLDGLHIEAFTGVIIAVAAQLLAALDGPERDHYITVTRAFIARGDALPDYLKEDL